MIWCDLYGIVFDLFDVVMNVSYGRKAHRTRRQRIHRNGYVAFFVGEKIRIYNTKSKKGGENNMKASTLVKSIATSAVTLSLMTVPAFAVDVVVDGNGAGSTNSVMVSAPTGGNGVMVNQSNEAVVTTTVSAVSSTGGLKADKNTGSNTSVTQSTGDATTAVGVTVVGGDNSATVGNECGCVAPVTVTVKNNGASSKNSVMVGGKSEKLGTVLKQKGKLTVGTVLSVVAKTGKVTANKNTGASVDQTTGDASTTVEVGVQSGSNSAHL